MYMGLRGYKSASACVYIYVNMYLCVYVCMYECMHVCMYACVYVCMYVCIRARMLCYRRLLLLRAQRWSRLNMRVVYIFIYIHTYTHTHVPSHRGKTSRSKISLERRGDAPLLVGLAFGVSSSWMVPDCSVRKTSEREGTQSHRRRAQSGNRKGHL